MNIFESPVVFLLFLAFFVPGFVSVKVYDITVASGDRDWAKSIFEVVGYSVLSYVVSSPIIYLTQQWGWWHNGIGRWSAAVVILLVLPAIYALLFLAAIRTDVVKRHVLAPEKKPWDFVFGGRQPYWVILHLKSGRRIGGLYAGRSFTSSYPADEQIYIQELYDLDDENRFVGSIPQSGGALVCGTDIEVLEFFDYEDTNGSDSDG